MNRLAFPLTLTLAVLASSTLVARSASAQSAPFVDDTTIVVQPDLLVPLVVAAEADVLANRHSLALARAGLVLQAGAPSPVRLRAQSVALVAMEALGVEARPAAPLDVVLEPLVRAVASQPRRSRGALALAQLDFVLARAPADSALVDRARALRAGLAPTTPVVVASEPVAPVAIAEAPIVVAEAPVAVAEPTTIVVPISPAVPTASVEVGAADLAMPPPPSPYGASAAIVPATSTATVATVTPIAEAPARRRSTDAEPEFASPEPEAPAAPVDPTRRGDAEVVELAITAGLFGAYAGFWIPFAAGLEGGNGREAGAANTAYSLSILAGGALFSLGALALDSGEGLRTGIAPSISVGLRLGTLSGFLLWGAADSSLSDTVHCPASSCAEQRAGWSERTAFPFFGGLTGLLTGAVVGYGLRPTTDQVRFVELQGTMWGSTIGLMLAIAAQTGGPDDDARGFGLTAGGLAAGVLATAIMSGFDVQMSQARAWLMTLGIVVGAGAAALVSAIVSGATEEWGAFPITFGGIGVATSITGLVVAGFLTDGMDAPRPDARRAGGTTIDIRPTIAPLEGGGMLGMNGTF